jgi:hypothetical protein
MTDFLFEEKYYEGTNVVLTCGAWEEKLLSPAPAGHPETVYLTRKVYSRHTN